MADEICRCDSCGGLVKPGVVFFGRGLPPDWTVTLAVSLSVYHRPHRDSRRHDVTASCQSCQPCQILMY